MEANNDGICRLCLKCEGDTFSPLDDACTDKLEVVIPELIIHPDGDFVICNKCKELLEESFKLNRVCFETEQFIRTQKAKENITYKVNINRIVNVSNVANGNTSSGSQNAVNICRICLKYKTANVAINAANTDDLITTALKTCLPELNAELTADPVICEVCHDTLRHTYSFVTECLSVGQKVLRYLESHSKTQSKPSKMNLKKVLTFINGKPETSFNADNFLAEFEIQDEVEGDIFDSLPNSEESSTSQDEVKKTIGNHNIPEEMLRYYDHADPDHLKAGKKWKKKNKKCYLCRQYGHTAKVCIQNFAVGFDRTEEKPKLNADGKNRKMPRGRCDYCGKYGHKKWLCPTKKPDILSTPKPPSDNSDAPGTSRQGSSNEKNFTEEMLLNKVRENMTKLGCLRCLSIQHDVSNCPKLKDKKSLSAHGVLPPPKPKGWVRGQDNFQKKYFKNEKLLYETNESRSGLGCLRCFGFDHEAKNCNSEHRRRNFTPY